ncbi:VOC family protein [Paenibacillus sp. NPDC056579]|uniref:VOC family protein n=1 Tax=Paenibacillus sp. NPDC056579 TaxID=3345871 RepID=UPI0036C2BED9
MNDDRHFRLGSAALYARDRERLITFYQTMFDMKLVGADESWEISLLAFERNAVHYDLSVVGDPRSVQMGVYASSLAVLKELWHKVNERGIPIRGPYRGSHGVSIQFNDPEGNRIEVTWPDEFPDQAVGPYAPEPAVEWSWLGEGRPNNSYELQQRRFEGGR